MSPRLAPRPLALAAALAAAAAFGGVARGEMAPPRTFGVGFTASQAPVCAAPTLLLNHTLSAGAELGILSHFWCTGDVDRNVVVEYFVDGEAAPSIAFEPAMASGQGFPQFIGDDPLAQQASLYEAAGKMGKAGPVGGWYFKYKIPFGTSVLAQIRLINGSKPCQYAYIQIRGHEVFPGEPGVVLPSGAALPRAARMQLQQIDNSTFAPLAQVALANISKGMSAVLFQVTLATSTYPPMNNYIEGCFHLLREANESFPGLVVGTGFEDFFNSAYWFGAASGFADGVLFQQADSGLVHFSVGAPKGVPGVEMLSAYRFLDAEVMGVSDGGRLVWRVGDTDGKCFETTTNNPIGTPSAVAVKSAVWLYAWPNGGGAVTPLPPIPQPGTASYRCGAGGTCEYVADASGPFLFATCDEQCHAVPVPPPVPGPPAVVGCASGQCDAFCNVSATVHGCLASWPATASLRAPATGKPCDAKNVCAAPADACAPGWALCLGNFSAAGADIAAFRAGISADACAAAQSDPRKFVAAMSHARAAWSNLPPAPCPPAPVDDDNGCAEAGTWGSEPVCCGGACVAPSCPGAVWTGRTQIHIDEDASCDALAGGVADGVLCCKLV